ncbi:MAG: type II toxin-antitoxin system HicB family antitoxin [Oscillospiraceae bacterium]|nr:type II toxin-antitoxin system HicB family antitoxin [Oscillospiraceae bacterium]MBR4545635.1 type II toxin-antitoxin system HicB family antitoxin [Oscillibacter sp.]
MTEYVYPAVFHPNADGSYTILYPDLPGCISEGKSMGNALYMAQAALTQWIGYLTDKAEPIPAASALRDVETEAGEFVNLIRADVKDNRAVRRTVSIPKWMDDKVTEAGLSLSRVLQDALKERLSAT